MNMRARALCCHQSGDMYGSDKVFKAAVIAIVNSGIDVIVMLASDGPLKAELEKSNILVTISPLGKIKRKDLTLFGLIALPFKIISGVLKIDKCVFKKDIDFVYVNTIVILSPLFWSVIRKRPLVWHVHEILDKPEWLKKVYAWLMNYIAFKVIFVSKAAENNYTKCFPKLKNKAEIIYNSYLESEREPNQPLTFSELKMIKELKHIDLIKIALVGRMSKLKGHVILMDAISLMSESIQKNVALVFVGDPVSGGEAYVDLINKKILSSPIFENTKVYPYTKNIDLVYENIDILVVPSVEVESFGLVAVEGMAHGCAVVASNIGGLSEIVTHEVDGLLVTPGSAKALAQAIETLVKNQSMRESLIAAGKAKVHGLFSQERFNKEIQGVFSGYQQL